MNVRLSQEQKIKVLNSEDLYKVMQQVLLRENKIDRNKEHFWVVCLASNNQILLIELISLGTVNQTLVEPMEVFSFALQKRAVQIIMVHNHPSGELKPTKSDIEVTDKMLAIGKFVNVPVIDHLIITEEKYYSFVDSGMLEKIEKETTYDLSFKQIDELKKEIAGIEKKKAIEMATRMLEDNQPIKVIAKYTGLSEQEITRLSNQ
ncbi:JAB domain-containing protein [Fulvivirga sp. 29W222]|uniref:JAB domain-containing protein n=1 Tax=Fulvivirga marina TaxID=2494733 RepID=A0A937G1V4_9BACT|nr:JAB domain-containing protein [Fulvivirga marina]MBL6448523.1 JAB domain-containing protein [Fulvivirga marina]